MTALLLAAILAAWAVVGFLVASHVGRLLAYARQTQPEPASCLCSRHAVSPRCPIHGFRKESA